jgi:muramoyltetrapeptide carboxypeptidase
MWDEWIWDLRWMDVRCGSLLLILGTSFWNTDIASLCHSLQLFFLCASCMNRKQFFKTTLPLGVAAVVAQNSFAAPVKTHHPPYLKKGDTIGITCSSGHIDAKGVAAAVAKLKEWNFEVQVGETVGKQDFMYGGTDAERLQELQAMLNNKKIKAILFGRGGYGFVRIIDKINWTVFKQHPKWLIGFSDVTVLHNHVHQQFGLPSIHSKMCNSFPDDWTLADEVQKASIESIQKVLVGEKMQYQIVPNALNKLGKAKGKLVGGNLSILTNMTGSVSELKTDGKILVIEDVSEYLYNIDRMLWNLKRNGKLKNLAALLIGGFTNMKDDEKDPFGKTVQEIVLDFTKEYKYPVCFDFPSGHQKNNFALKLGMPHALEVTAQAASFKEL